MWIRAQSGNLLNLNQFDKIYWRDQCTSHKPHEKGFIIVASLSDRPIEEVIGLCKTKEELDEMMAKIQHIVGADQKLF